MLSERLKRERVRKKQFTLKFRRSYWERLLLWFSRLWLRFVRFLWQWVGFGVWIKRTCSGVWSRSWRALDKTSYCSDAWRLQKRRCRDVCRQIDRNESQKNDQANERLNCRPANKGKKWGRKSLIDRIWHLGQIWYTRKSDVKYRKWQPSCLFLNFKQIWGRRDTYW